MPTRTTPQPRTRIGRRPAPAPQGRFSRPGRPSRRTPQQSSPQKALSALTGALPGVGHSATKSKGRRADGGGKRRAGGMALLAGGLGLALKNRDKLGGLLGRRRTEGTPPPTTPMP